MLTWSEKVKAKIIHRLHSKEWRARHVEITENMLRPETGILRYRWKMDDPAGGGEILGTEKPVGSVHDVVFASGFEKGRKYKAVRVRAKY
jgi:hypothetical protein